MVAQRRLKDTGIERTTLDSAVLQDNVARSMADVLTRHSTLFVKSYGRATESTAEFRGTSPAHTQVLWNGMRVNSPMLGTFDFSTVPSYLIDEVNLYHGASSLNVTGGALGGAVEMLTLPEKRDGLHAQYTQGIGSFGTYDQFARLNYHRGRWTTSTRLLYATSNNRYTYTNYDKKTDLFAPDGSIIASYHPREENKSGYFDDVHALQDIFYQVDSRNTLSLNLWYSYSKRGLPFLSVDYKDEADFRNEQVSHTLRSVLSWKSQQRHWTLNTRAGYLYGGMDYDYYTTRPGAGLNTITASRSHTNTAFLHASVDWFVGEKWMLTGSLQADYNHVRSADLSPFHQGQNMRQGRMDTDIHLQARWRPTPILSFSALVRQQFHGTAASSPIPAFFADVIIYKPWNLVLKGSLARNYRFPSMDDLYYQPGGNPNLRPEKGFTYDFGLEFAVKRKRWTARGNVTAFDSYIDDWILWTPNVKGYWIPSNVRRVHNYGLEAMGQVDVLLARDWKLSISGNYAWTPSRNVGEPQSSLDRSYGRQLCYIPLMSANAQASLAWRTWTLGVQWSHYGERYTTTSNEVDDITGKLKPYYMTDCSLEKSFSIRRHTLSLKAVVNNLLDSEYVTVLSHPMPGRNFQAVVTVKY